MALLALSGLRASAQLFTVTNNGPLTVESGHYGTFTVTVTPSGNLSALVAINCSNLPANSECFFPQSVNGLEVSNTPATMTVIFDSATVYNYETKATPLRRGTERVALASLFASALCVLFVGRRRLRVWPGLRMMVCALALLPLAGLAGCASTKPLVTPPGNYLVNVSASYGTFTANSTLNITVTP